MEMSISNVCAFLGARSGEGKNISSILCAYGIFSDILPSEEGFSNEFILDWKDVLIVLLLHSESKDQFSEP
jgi:hypothetical protein